MGSSESQRPAGDVEEGRRCGSVAHGVFRVRSQRRAERADGAEPIGVRQAGHRRDAAAHRETPDRASLLRGNRAVVGVDVVHQLVRHVVVVPALRLRPERAVVAIRRGHDDDELVLARHRGKRRPCHEGGVILAAAVEEIHDRIARLRGLVGLRKQDREDSLAA